MTRLKAHMIGLALIPVIWIIMAIGAIFVAASMLIVLGVLTLALIVVPGQVQINGTTLYRILRKARK